MYFKGVCIALIFSMCPFLEARKKALILSTDIGAGHSMAVLAISEYLKDHFVSKAINIVETVTEPLDPLYTFTNGSYSGAKAVSRLSQKNWNRTLNFFYKQLAHPLGLRPMWGKMEEHALTIFKEENPDLIVSVIPALNKPLIAAAQRLDKPYVLTILDADYSMWRKGLNKVNYEKFRLIVPFVPSEKKRSAAYIQPSVLPQTLEWGIPLRKKMTHSFNKEVFKKKWHFARNKPNILLMMGGQSSDAMLEYVAELAALRRDYHVFVFIGSHEELGEKVKKVAATSQQVTFRVVPFTLDAPYFLRSADLLISKPGGLTSAEVLTAQIPTVFDATRAQLFWERSNMMRVVKSGYGRALRKLSQLDTAIRESLNKGVFADQNFKQKELLFGERFLDLSKTLAQQS